MSARRREIPAATRATRLAANVGLLTVALFGIDFLVTTQVRDIRVTLPWTDDPYDAVVSVAAILLPFVVGVTWLRSVRNRGADGIPAPARSRIHRGVALALALVLAAVTAQIAGAVALGIVGVSPAVLALVAATTIAAVGAVGLLAHAALVHPEAPGELAAPEPEPDTVDDIVTLAHDSARGLERVVPAIGRVIDSAATWLDALVSSRTGPRHHRIAWIVIAALTLGAAGCVWKALVEGPWVSLGAAAVYGGILAAIIALGLGVLGPYLRVLRRA